MSHATRCDTTDIFGWNIEAACEKNTPPKVSLFLVIMPVSDVRAIDGARASAIGQYCVALCCIRGAALQSIDCGAKVSEYTGITGGAANALHRTLATSGGTRSVGRCIHALADSVEFISTAMTHGGAIKGVASTPARSKRYRACSLFHTATNILNRQAVTGHRPVSLFANAALWTLAVEFRRARAGGR